MPRRIVFAVLFSMVLLPLTLFAQLGASLQGTVTDSSGAAVPNAKITVTQEATGRAASTTSSATGFYSIRGLAPGAYTVRVDAPTFQPLTTAHVSVAAESVRGFDPVVVPATAEKTVEVSESAAGVQTETASVSGAISSRDFDRLPQFGRDPYNLLRLAPGVFGDNARSGSGGAFSLPNANYGPGGSNQSIYQVENQVQVSAGGQRISSNTFEVDGVNVNSLTWGGAAVLTPNIESVEQVKVVTGSYSAEDGRNSGADVKVVSKTGTNQWHGSGIYRYDEPGLNAFNKFYGNSSQKIGLLTCTSGTAKFTINAAQCPLRVQQKLRDFGGSIGGPIVHNKLFFFFSYEGLRQNDQQTLNRYVETQQYRQLIIQQRANSQMAKVLSSPGVEPRIQAILPTDCSLFGGVNGGNSSTCHVVTGGIDLGGPAGATGTYAPSATPGNFDGIPDLIQAQIAVPSHTRGNQFNGRVDYTRGNDTFAVSSYVTTQNSVGADAGAQGRPMADLNFQPLIPVITTLWNHVFSGTLLNEARLNFNRYAFNQVSSNAGANFNIPRIEVEGMPINDRIRFGANRSETTPGIFVQNTYEFRDIVSKVWRSHAFKFGGEIRKEQDNNNLLGGARPDYSFVGLFNLANETPVFEAINIDPRTATVSGAQRYFRTNDLAFFAQDDWKPRSDLTLNFGLRWEYFSPITDKGGRLSNLIIPGGDLTAAYMKIGGDLYKPDRNNFAPRFGFAYAPGHFNNKAVIRGGVGVSYNRIPDVLFANSRANPPFFAREGLCCGFASSPFAGNTILFSLSSSGLLGYPVSPTLKQGIDPTTNLPVAGGVEIWGAFQNTPTPYVYNYSLETEYALPAAWTVVAGYEGSDSKKLVRIVNQNFVRPKLNPRLSAVYFPTPDVTANFNALNLRANHSFSHGLEFMAKYRWSRSMDELSNEGPCACANQTYPQNLAYEYGPSDYDVKHFWLASALWDIPVFRGRHDFAGTLLGGWQINGIFTYHTGFPWTPVQNRVALQTPGGLNLSPVRPIAYFGGAGTSQSNSAFLNGTNFPNGPVTYFNISKPGIPGIGRNAFRGPQYQDLDLSLVKNFALNRVHWFGERGGLELRANMFNALNKLNPAPFGFNTSSTVINGGDVNGQPTSNPNFGRATTALAGRVVEFQARFSF